MYRTIVAALLLAAGSAQASLQPDAEFGAAGYVDVDFGIPIFYGAPKLVALPDHRVVAGLLPREDSPTPPQLKLTRRLADGTPDPGFGANGIVTVPLSPTPADYGYLKALELQADGKLLAMAYTTRTDPAPPGGQPTYHYELRVLRLNADGSADAGFNGGQPRLVDSSARAGAMQLLPQADGLIVIDVEPRCCGGSSGFHAWHLRADGSLDPAFGNGGELVVAADASVSTAAMTVPGGGFQVLHSVAPSGGAAPRNFWRRYRADGSLDGAYGNGGTQEIPLTEAIAIERVQSLGDGSWLGFSGACPMRLFDAEGRPVGALATCPAFNHVSGFAAQRYGSRLLFKGDERFGGLPPPSDGTYLHVTDRSGQLDRDFAGTPDGRWRSPDAPSAPYAVAADGSDRVLLSRGTDTGLRIWRYRELRGSVPAATPLPVPALGPGALLLILAGVLLLARRRMRRVYG